MSRPSRGTVSASCMIVAWDIVPRGSNLFGSLTGSVGSFVVTERPFSFRLGGVDTMFRFLSPRGVTDGFVG